MSAKVDFSKPWAGMVPLESVVRNPEQPRVRFPKEEIERLGESMSRPPGQTSPCTVIPYVSKVNARVAWMLVDGECRWRAAKEKGLPELYVSYKPGITVENLHLASFAANFCRTPHTKEETARAIDKERAAGRSYEDIAATVGKSHTWARAHHDLLKLHPRLLKWMDEPDPQVGRKLSMNVATQLVTIEDQDTQMARWVKVRELRGAEQFHKLRSHGVVGAGRNPSDDRDYLAGLINTAQGRLKAVAEAGEVLLRRLSVDSLEGLMERLDRVEAEVKRARVRIGKFLPDFESEVGR